MNKLRNIIKNLCLGLLMVCTVGGFAQIDNMRRAQDLYGEKKSEAARLAIDSAVVHPETKADPYAWTLRAFIYYDLYKKTDRYRLESPLRDSVVNSVKKSLSFNPEPENLKNNKSVLMNVAFGYFNIAKRLLQDSVNDTRSQIAYNKSKELGKICRPDTNFTNADIEWYNSVGSLFADLYNKDNANAKAQEVAKVALLKVIELQPDNWRANYNLGIMYYNHAVNLTKSLDYSDDFSKIDAVQESIIKLAKQSEQLIDKVHKKDPNNVKTIEALYYIYRMLNDNAKHEFFRKKAAEKGIKVD
jgi:hypothetical protein